MYKRKARVLFVCTDASRSPIAHGFADAVGSAWLEARAAATATSNPDPCAIAVMREIGLDIGTLQCMRLESTHLAWPDLIVTLSAEARAHCHALPAGKQAKHWSLSEGSVCAEGDLRLAELRVVRDELREHVAGMIGGMRMLAKMDAGEQDS